MRPIILKVVVDNQGKVKLKEVKADIDQINGSLSKLNFMLNTISASLLIYQGIVKVQQAIKQTGEEIIKFNRISRQIEGVASVNVEAMKLIEEAAIRVSNKTEHMATAVAGALLEMTKMGLSPAEAIGSIEEIANLATGSMTDMNQAMLTTAATAQMFNIPIKYLGRVADMIHVVVSGTSMDFESFIETIKLAAPILNTFGMGMKESFSLMGLLAQRGLKGSVAGTALKNAIVDLIKTSPKLREAFKNAGIDEAATSFENIANAMKQAGFNLKDYKKIFTLRGITSVLSLNSEKSVDELHRIMKSLDDYKGQAAKSAEIVRKAWEMEFKNIKNIFINIGIEMSRIFFRESDKNKQSPLERFKAQMTYISDYLKANGPIISEKIGKMFNALYEFFSFIRDSYPIILRLLKALVFAKVASMFVSSLQMMSLALSSFSIALRAIIASQTKFGSLVNGFSSISFIGALGGLTIAGYAYYQMLVGVAEKMELIQEKMQRMNSDISEQGYTNRIDYFTRMQNALEGVYGVVTKLNNQPMSFEKFLPTVYSQIELASDPRFLDDARSKYGFYLKDFEEKKKALEVIQNDIEKMGKRPAIAGKFPFADVKLQSKELENMVATLDKLREENSELYKTIFGSDKDIQRVIAESGKGVNFFQEYMIKVSNWNSSEIAQRSKILDLKEKSSKQDDDAYKRLMESNLQIRQEVIDENALLKGRGEMFEKFKLRLGFIKDVLKGINSEAEGNTVEALTTKIKNLQDMILGFDKIRANIPFNREEFKGTTDMIKSMIAQVQSLGDKADLSLISDLKEALFQFGEGQNPIFEFMDAKELDAVAVQIEKVVTRITELRDNLLKEKDFKEMKDGLKKMFDLPVKVDPAQLDRAKNFLKQHTELVKNSMTGENELFTQGDMDQIVEKLDKSVVEALAKIPKNVWEKAIEQLKETKNFQETLKEKFDFTGTILGMANDLINSFKSIYDFKINEINRAKDTELKALDDIYQRQIFYAGNSNRLKFIAERNYMEKKKAMEDEYLAKEKDAKEKQRGWAVVQSVIDTALAVMNALSTVKPFPLAIAAASMAAITGSIQTALIAKQKFAMGGLVTGRGGRTSDSIPIMASVGEYVVPANVVRDNGGATRLQDKLNSDTMGYSRVKTGVSFYINTMVGNAAFVRDLARQINRETARFL